MGKRSDFERVSKDYYPTPISAVIPLLPHLMPNATFYEPCAGDGRLINHLESNKLLCKGAWDIEPQADNIKEADALELDLSSGADYIITNPPWDRNLLHPMIEHFSNQLPTWLLFDADWMHTKQSIPFMNRCEAIISVGRVKWIEGSKSSGKDNCCWYLFSKPKFVNKTLFVGRR